MPLDESSSRRRFLAGAGPRWTDDSPWKTRRARLVAQGPSPAPAATPQRRPSRWGSGDQARCVELDHARQSGLQERDRVIGKSDCGRSGIGTTLAAMAKTYQPYVPEQDLLLPPSLRDWLPEGHLAFFVSDLIDQLDLSAITSVYEEDERGYPPYHPVMMTKLLVYAYCVGVFSSRKMHRRLVEDVAFRVLAAGNVPDHRTIGDFRKRHLTALQGFFEQVLRLARELGAPRVGRVALDGKRSRRTPRSTRR